MRRSGANSCTGQPAARFDLPVGCLMRTLINNQVFHPILAKAASLQVSGKSPAGFYLRLNKRI
jgi:hypothetical protein